MKNSKGIFLLVSLWCYEVPIREGKLCSWNASPKTMFWIKILNNKIMKVFINKIFWKHNFEDIQFQFQNVEKKCHVKGEFWKFV